MSDLYETEKLLHEYLLFHYGEAEQQMPWESGPRDALFFPVRAVSENIDTASLGADASALDIGCAVGRSSFELARHCARVIGIDYSFAFIAAARALCREAALPYLIKETGDIHVAATARRPDVDCARVHFEQGDAHDLRESLGSFDVVLAANLLCRLADPRRLLRRLPDLVKPGGQLIITTPNTWLEEFTAKPYWIGASPETGEPLEVLRGELDDAFELECVRDMPFVIREHRRKYQWSVAQATRWRRRSPRHGTGH